MFKIEKLNLDWRYALTPIGDVDKLVLHHPAHKTWGPEDIHDYHRNSLGWNGAGYNYMVMKDGRIYELRGKNVGAHVKGYNNSTLGITFQGNFEEEEMTNIQVRAGGWLISKLMEEEGLSLDNVVGHRDLAATSCPGENFRMDDVKRAATSKTDIEGHWAEKEIRKVLTEGTMNGYPDGTFKPDKALTRAELAYLIAKGVI